MKKVDFRVMSNVKCDEIGCKTHLKQNVVNRKPTARKCYKHFKIHDQARRNRR